MFQDGSHWRNEAIQLAANWDCGQYTVHSTLHEISKQICTRNRKQSLPFRGPMQKDSLIARLPVEGLIREFLGSGDMSLSL